MKKSYIWIVTETDWCGGYQEGCDILLKAFDDENKAIKFKEGLEQKQNEASKNYYSYSQVFSLISKYTEHGMDSDEDLIKNILRAEDDIEENKLRKSLELIRKNEDNEEMLLNYKSWNIEKVEYDRTT